MEFSQDDLNKLLEFRKFLVLEFEKARDYKSNPNALMKEIDHARFVSLSIKRIDAFLSKYVQFS